MTRIQLHETTAGLEIRCSIQPARIASQSDAGDRDAEGIGEYE